MRKFFTLLVSMLVIASCTDPFDASSIWDKLNEHENKINDIENGTNSSDEVVTNKIYYTTSDGNKLFPKNTEPADWGAILLSNIYENGVGVLTFDNGITSISKQAFSDCSSLTSITIPNSVTSIGAQAFYGCSGLTSIEIPNSVTSIGEEAFCRCSSLNSAKISESITIINTGTFSRTALTSATIPEGVISLGTWAFDNCPELTNVNLPKTLTTIGGNAFENCPKLAEITLHNNVTSIYGNAFRDCINLKTIINFSNLELEKGATNNGYIAYYANIVRSPIKSITELNANNRYYIFTERGSWAVDSDNKILKSNIQLELEMDMYDACQQFIISKKNNQYYLYSPVEECYINKDCSLSSTPVDAINFKQGDKYATFVVYFDDDHYININSYKHIVTDSWKTPDPGNSCYIMPID